MLHGRQEWENDHDDLFRTRPRGFEWGVGSVDIAIAGKSPRFFSPDFLYMKTLTDELLGIKHDKFAIGDLVRTKSASNANGMPWLGVVTTVTVLTSEQGEVRNVYTVEWIDMEATQILWYDWYDEDLVLIQQAASC